MEKIAVVAIGGNSLIKDKNHSTVEDQYNAICETVSHIVNIIEEGYKVVITHGNGPQVGFNLRRSEIAEESEGMHPVPLVNCGANTQGSIGYQIQQAFDNEFLKRGINKKAVSVVTQVEVDKDDKAFINPTKPIGSFYTKEETNKLRNEHPDWVLIEDAKRGYRRVVPSPMPKNVVEKDAIKDLINTGYVVIAVGGGGIPVIRDEEKYFKGVDAVIDKDYASSLLAIELKADLFIVSTGVEKVCINYGTDKEKALDKLNIEETKKLIEEGHFAPGSMLPKINAILNFLENSNGKAIITSPEKLKESVKGEDGTHLIK
ncbi:carbamate kinase [Anaerosalibacter massiliensis]|uniref:Carbamate kinase n=1 Tax=Anaerosalibacter massiliensis TaxID=1347392 RepID=A0A9X2MG97_9FIRM|nr:carbamate kinase [Anaerosalibacter massiliensis]MCR2042983.1 carbamate kinase [Anaerosalibacter massiliensis]